jgi:hypothetical protein
MFWRIMAAFDGSEGAFRAVVKRTGSELVF